MRKLSILLLFTFTLIALIARREIHGQTPPSTSIAAIPGTVGGQDTFGAYDIVKGWPKDISTLPGNEKWTRGAGASSLRAQSRGTRRPPGPAAQDRLGKNSAATRLTVRGRHKRAVIRTESFSRRVKEKMG